MPVNRNIDDFRAPYKKHLRNDLALLSQSPDLYCSLQDYKFCAILYPDATNYEVSLDDILQYRLCFFANYYYICHDKDLNSDGSLKKPHYHLVVKKSSPSTIGIVSSNLGIPFNYIQRCCSLKGAIRYLTHDEYDDKTRYMVDEIITNDDSISKFFNSADDDDMAQEIINFIFTCSEPSVSAVTSWVMDKGYYSAFRRGFALFSSLIRERCSYR